MCPKTPGRSRWTDRNPSLLTRQIAIALAGLAGWFLASQAIGWLVRDLAGPPGAVFFATYVSGLTLLPLLLLLPLAGDPLRREVVWLALGIWACLLGLVLWRDTGFAGLQAGTLFAVFAGAVFLARGFPRVEYILPCLIVLAAMDTWSVYAGFTRGIIRSNLAVQILTLAIPPLGEGEHSIRPRVGFTDLFFLFSLVSLSTRYGLPLRRTLAGLAAGLWAGWFIAGLSGSGIPMLPFLALGFTAAQGGRLPWRGRDLLTAVLFSAAVIGLLELLD